MEQGTETGSCMLWGDPGYGISGGTFHGCDAGGCRDGRLLCAGNPADASDMRDVPVIGRLQAVGIRCVCACSERKVFEERLDDGTIRKTSVFEFRQFREYDKPDCFPKENL